MAVLAHAFDACTAVMIDLIMFIPVWMFAGGCSSWGGASVMNDTCGSVLFVQSLKNCVPLLMSLLVFPPLVPEYSTRRFGKSHAQHAAEVVRAQRELREQGIVIRQVRRLVIPHGGLAVGGVEAVHLAVIPLAVDRVPVVIGVAAGQAGEVERLDRPAVPVRLSEPWRCPEALGQTRVGPEVVVERVVLLAADDDVLDRGGRRGPAGRPFRARRRAGGGRAEQWYRHSGQARCA